MFWQRLMDMVAPQACVVCGKRVALGDGMVCSDCNRELPRTNHIAEPYDNEMAKLFWGRIENVERCAAFMLHQPQTPSSQIIYDMKYRDRPEIGGFMGKMMAEEFARKGFFSDIDGIVPIPLSRQKERRRGYNQSRELARGICEATGLPLMDKVVKRVIDTESQTQKSRLERSDNMEGAFQLVDAAAIENRHLLIVDDVVTTGATICSCVSEMQRSAPCRVSIHTLGITKS